MELELIAEVATPQKADLGACHGMKLCQSAVSIRCRQLMELKCQNPEGRCWMNRYWLISPVGY